VSSSTVTKHKVIGHGAPAARLIPGASLLPNALLRKKPQSVSVDGRYWTETESPSPQPNPNAFQLLAQAVLPAPAMRGQRRRLAGLVCADFMCLSFTFMVVSNFRMLATAIFRQPSSSWTFPAAGLGFVFLQGAMLTLLAYSEGLYRAELMWSPEEQRVVLGKVVGLSTALLALGTYLLESKFISLAALALSAPLNYATMVGCREWQRRVSIRTCGRTARNVLIVGGGRLARELAACFDGNARSGRQFRGFLVESGPIGGDIRGTIEDLACIARAEFIDEVVLTDTRDPLLARRVIREAQRNRLDVKIVPDLFGFRPRGVALEDFGDVPVLTLHEETIPASGLLLKRLLDIMGSAAALLLSAPLLSVIALLIKFDSVGAVFYTAPRVGRKGRRFHCYKFRTMVSGANDLKERLRSDNEREGPFFKIVGDPRITRAGRFLRRYSLDELPQLWNVLLGDMSLVGPRPHPVDDCEHYDLDDLRRLDVTPGITGLWQVTARRDPSFERNMALDLEYIEKWSLGMDLRILLKTVAVVLQGTGA